MEEVTQNGLFITRRSKLPECRDFVRIYRGVYLDSAIVPITEDAPWKTRQTVTELRCEAVAMTRKSQDAVPIFTGEAALCLWGIDTWFSVPDLQAWRSDGEQIRWRCTLPEVSVHGVVVASCKYNTLQGKRLGSEVYFKGGCLVVSPVEAVVDLARSGHPVQIIMAASAVLREMSDFTQFDQDGPRVEAAKVQQEMIALLQAAPRLSRTAIAAVEAADPGCEGPGEAYLRWLLSCVTDISRVDTQRLIRVNGKEYYVDAAVRNSDCGWEFDGYGKVDKNSESRGNFVNRQNALTNAKAKMMRLSPADYVNPAVALQKVVNHLRDCGISVHPPTKCLYKSFPAHFFAYERRN